MTWDSICTHGNSSWGALPNKTWSEHLLDLKAMMPKRNRKVYQFDGTMEQFKIELEKAGVKTEEGPDLPMLFDLDVVAVPDYNCVLIGNIKDIEQVIKDKKEEHLAGITILEGLDDWLKGRSDGTDHFIHSKY